MTVPRLMEKKRRHEPIVALTAYDAPFAALLDQAGVDLILVGDSVANVVQGLETTIPVTLEEMAYHTRLVARSVRQALLVADLPFGSYQASPEEAVRSAVVLLKAGAAAVKLEGGVRMQATIERLVEADIPVMGHVGLTPQSVHALGGYKVQRDAKRLLRDARAVQAAGAFSVVLEAVPARLAAEVTAALRIPTVGIGAGKRCDGQILVLHDLLGLSVRAPKFAKRYAQLGQAASEAVKAYAAEVRAGKFPGAEHSF